jgi:peptidoglycan/xylan/chitin deacetylase (PgdA/CDA1 family)
MAATGTMKTPRRVLRAVRRQIPLRWLERLRLACNGIVLMFHEVEDDSVCGLRTGSTVAFLEAVIVQLRGEGWEIVTLDEALCRLGQGDPSRRFAVLTFDDGYRDTLTRALPILERYDTPFTAYIPTAAPTRGLCSWWLGVRALFERHDAVAIAGMQSLFTCVDRESKMRGYQEVSNWIHRDYRRTSQLMETFREYEISLTDLNCTYFMDEAQLRALARHPLATIGGHSTSHGALSTCDADQARREMTDNRAYLEKLLGRPVLHFAYPYGTSIACGPREFGLAAEVGFRSAVTARYGPVFGAHRHRPHALPRIAAARVDKAADFPALLRNLRDAVRSPAMALP